MLKFLSKSLFLFLIFLLLINTRGISQESFFGVKAGYNISSLISSNNPAIELNNRNAFNASFVISLRSMQSKWGFSLEPGYILKGASSAIDSIEYRFSYISMPILLEYNLLDKLKISAGPEVSYLISSKNKGTGANNKDIGNIYRDGLELSATIGAAYSLDYFIDIGVRYNLGLTSITDFDPQLGANDLRNQYFQLFILLKIAN